MPRQFLQFLFILDVSRAVWAKMGANASIPFFFTTLRNGIGTARPDDLTAINFIVLLITFTFWALRMISLLVAFMVL